MATAAEKEQEQVWNNQQVWIWEHNEWVPGVVQSLQIKKVCASNVEMSNVHIFTVKLDNNKNGGTVITVNEEAPVPQVDGTAGEYARLKKRHEAMNPQNCTDMTLLLNLNEPEIIECLKLRFSKKFIYTSIGPILVAVNPFERLENLYGPVVFDQYLGKSAAAARQLGPHVYQLSEAAYQKMFIDKFNPDKRENQSILVNGESGAGKTESTKQVLRYLTNVSTVLAQSLRDKGVEIPDDNFESMIIAANPITESFGNAKTSRNNNSSRFGKFIELNYSVDGYIESASITTYLLETVRLVRQSAGERNYHIFYEIYSSLSPNKKEEFALTSLADFRYTNQSNEYNRHDGESDEENFTALSNALTQCGLDDAQKMEVFSTVVGVLHLGNLSFSPADNNGVEVSPNCEVHIQKIEQLLGLQREDLVAAVTKKKVVIAGSEIMKELDEVNAVSARDSFAKILYDLLFKWLIRQVNISLKCTVDTRASFIGILDIFGFEYFTHNSFEQLCINYANEKLQDHFNYSTFKSEQDVYLEEGLNWTFVEYPDNSQRLGLFEHRSTGLFALTDENLRIPSSNDTRLAQSIYNNHLQVEQSYVTATNLDQRHLRFTVRHFACDVTYAVTGFLDKNRSEVSTLINECMSRSLVNLVSEIENPMTMNGGTNLPNLMRGTSLVRATAAGGGGGGGVTAARPGATVIRRTTTVASQFSSQLKDLMIKIKETRSHFIRCIKPNAELKKEIFTVPMVMDQIRCGGALGAVQVLRAGFPNRMEFKSFVNRYSALMWVCGKNLYTDDILKFETQMRRLYPERLRNPLRDEMVRAGLLIHAIPVTISVLDRLEGRNSSQSDGAESEEGGAMESVLTEGLQMGRTRIFLRANAFEYLERLHLRAKICSATYLQRRWRAKQAARHLRGGSGGIGGRRRASQTSIETMLYFTELTRYHILRTVWATALLQRRARVFIAQTRYAKALHSVRRIQTRIRMFLAKRLVNKLRHQRRSKAAIRIQTLIRKRLTQKKFMKQMTSVLKIQCFLRGNAARSQVNSLRREELRKRREQAAFIIQMVSRRFIARVRVARRRQQIQDEKNRADLAFASNRIAELEAEVEALKSSQQSLIQETTTLRTESTLKDRQITELSLELDKTRSNSSLSESLAKRIPELETEVKERDQKISELSGEVESKEQQVSSLTNETAVVREEIEELRGQLLTAAAREVQSSEEHNTALAKAKETNAENELRIADLERALAEMESQLLLAQQQPQIPDPEPAVAPVAAADEEKIRSLETEMATREEIWNEERATKNQQILELTQECEELRSRAAAATRVAETESQTAAPPTAASSPAPAPALQESPVLQQEEQHEQQEQIPPSTASVTLASSSAPSSDSAASAASRDDLEARIASLEQELLSRDRQIQELSLAAANKTAAPAAVVVPVLAPAPATAPEAAAPAPALEDSPVEVIALETSTESPSSAIPAEDKEGQEEEAEDQSFVIVNESPETTARVDPLPIASSPAAAAAAQEELITTLRNELRESELRSQEMLRDLSDVIRYLRKEVDGYHKEAMEIQNELYQSLVERQEELDDEATKVKLQQLQLEHRGGSGGGTGWFSRLMGGRK